MRVDGLHLLSLLASTNLAAALQASAVQLSAHRSVFLYQEEDNGDYDYGARLWGCSIGMARWLSADAEINLSGVRVLELGAGTGLVSLALAAAGAVVTATDISDKALRLIEMAAHEQTLPVSATRFDVCGTAPLPPADLVVASDVLYTPQLADALARRCVEALDAGAYVVIGDPGRQDARESFFEALEEQNRVLPRVRSTWDAGSCDWLAGAARPGGGRCKTERLLLLHFESRSDPFRCATHQDLDQF